MATLVAATDWSKTPLGPRESWSPALEAAVGICISARFPMLVMWGPEETMVYNDGYAPMLQAKHPGALGIPGGEAWPEVWDAIGAMNQGVRETGVASWSQDLPLVLERNGFPEECYFTFSMSPIPEGGKIAGILATVVETTAQVVGERRMTLIRRLSEVASRARSTDTLYPAITDALTEAAADIPFAHLYLVGEAGATLRLSTGGLALEGVDVPPGTATHALLQQAVRTHAPVDVPDIGGLWEPVESPSSSTRPAPHAAIALPVRARGEVDTLGVLVAGLNPMRPADETTRNFLDLVAGSIATGIADALAAEAERRATAEAEELSAAKSAFLSTVSHEFRTPLTLLLGPVEDVLADPTERLSPENRDRLVTAHRNALRLRRLVNSLLEFASREDGGHEPHWHAVDLSALTARLAGAFDSAARGAGLELEVDCPPLPHPAVVDPESWERVVLNLVSNALKHTWTGAIRVTLDDEDGAIVLRVRDTGTGIPAEELPRLFERFHRVHGAEGRSHEGSGIGLALVAEIAAQHGGTVDVVSELGDGSTFTVRIPYGHDRIAPDRLAAPSLAGPTLAPEYVADLASWEGREKAELPPVPTAGPGEPGTRRRVLVADDNADMRAYLRRLLEREFDVEVVSDGRAALARALADPPDLLLTDVMMPGLDGLDLLNRLRAEPATQRVPIVLLSARAGHEASVDALAAGADDYLIKPFSAPELVARVRANLELGAMRERATAHQAALYAREHALVEELQRSLLPDKLPALPDVRLAGRYLPASPDAAVGGDWFDVMRLPDERVMVVVGDVVGHGLKAASTMSHLRTATRAYAAEGHDAAGIVDRVSTLVERTGVGLGSTMVLACVDTATGALTYSAAGHPPALVCHRDGGARWLEHGLAPPLGLASAQPARQAQDVLADQEGLLLYTDGLVERRDVELQARLDALAEAAAAGDGDPERLLDRLLTVMDVATERGDDVALIALEHVGARSITAFELLDADGLGDAREQLRDWLHDADADEDTVDEVVLAVSEALINAIEHAGDDEANGDPHVWVRATAFEDRMRIVVRDTGRWRRQGPARARGHGLRIIRALMDEVLLDPTADGTRVELQRRMVR